MKRALVILLSLVVLFTGAFAVWLLVGAEKPYKGYSGVEQFVEIPPGAGPASIGRRLAQTGVIRDQLSFRITLARSGQARRLQAGEYRFDRPMTTREVIDKIARGDVFLRPVTFREGLTVRQMAEIYERDGGGSKAEFLRAAENASLIHDIDPAAPDLEGYLFPDTYTLPRRTTADQLVQRMVTAFRDVMTPDLVQRAAARGMSVRELMTLASLVEKETGKPGERPIVAAVYTNRLKIGMGMQCDPTVIYALERAGKYDGNLTRENLQFDSPYNTYRYAGLPPGPIAAPGRASIEAAASPADVPYLYFVSRNDGSHVFSATLDEHNRNVYEFQKKPNRH
ncbi:MAG TPA: endolytic transglycosylase MltG [Vicinamibacterales bacterium]|nr:endolytic transglycosylase MltG [Vicinamibacterales bacterium]